MRWTEVRDSSRNLRSTNAGLESKEVYDVDIASCNSRSACANIDTVDGTCGSAGAASL